MKVPLTSYGHDEIRVRLLPYGSWVGAMVGLEVGDKVGD